MAPGPPAPPPPTLPLVREVRLHTRACIQTRTRSYAELALARSHERRAASPLPSLPPLPPLPQIGGITQLTSRDPARSNPPRSPRRPRKQAFLAALRNATHDNADRPLPFAHPDMFYFRVCLALDLDLDEPAENSRFRRGFSPPVRFSPVGTRELSRASTIEESSRRNSSESRRAADPPMLLPLMKRYFRFYARPREFLGSRVISSNANSGRSDRFEREETQDLSGACEFRISANVQLFRSI